MKKTTTKQQNMKKKEKSKGIGSFVSEASKFWRVESTK